MKGPVVASKFVLPFNPPTQVPLGVKWEVAPCKNLAFCQSSTKWAKRRMTAWHSFSFFPVKHRCGRQTSNDVCAIGRDDHDAQRDDVVFLSWGSANCRQSVGWICSCYLSNLILSVVKKFMIILIWVPLLSRSNVSHSCGCMNIASYSTTTMVVFTAGSWIGYKCRI